MLRYNKGVCFNVGVFNSSLYGPVAADPPEENVHLIDMSV